MIKIQDLALLLIALSGITYLWFAGTHLMEIHLPPVVAAIGIYVSLIIVFSKDKFSISPTTKAIFLVSLILIGWMFLRELFARTEFALIIGVVGGRVLVGVIIAFSLWFLTTKLWHLRFVTYVFIAAITVSAIVGIGQYFVGEPFVRLWELTGGHLPKLWEVRLGYIAGLATYSIPFSYQLCTFVPLVFGLCISHAVKHRKVFFMIFLLLLLSLFLTQARSAIAGTLLGIVVVMWSVQRKLKRALLFLSFGALAYLLYGVYVNPRIITFAEPSAQARLPLFIAALWTVLAQPFGTGRAAYTEVASGFYGLIEKLPEAEMILEHTAHNQFLNMLGYYGIPGLVLAILFYVLLFQLLRMGKTTAVSTRFLSGMKVGLLGSFTAYLINSLFHNAGPFIGDPFNWYFIGLALATNKLLTFNVAGGKSA